MSCLPDLIAVSGGIGAGKSVVSRILRAMGFMVYDCDSEAKRIVDSNPELKKKIDLEVAPGCLGSDGTLNRRLLADVVFSDPAKLGRLNSLVHSAVLADIRAWHSANHRAGEPMFVETAILYQSGLDRLVTEVWEVEASDETRIVRVMARNSLTADEVRARIDAQSFTPDSLHERVRTIDNDGARAILPQIIALLGGRRPESR